MTTEESVSLPSVAHASLYVGDLPVTVDEKVLIDKFSKVGPVYNARICRDMTTKCSLGYGYVNFCDPKDAERALDLMNYELIHNRPIRLMWCQRDPSLRKSGRGNIFIKNLAKNISQKELYDTFGCFGTILSCKIALDDTGNSKGFGYVHFESEEIAEKAIEKINGMSILGQIVYVGHFVPRTCRLPEAVKPRFNNLYVKSFAPETTEDSLREMFSEFGDIISCVVAIDSDGKPKGFGFVCFKDPDCAEAAAKAMHGKEVGGRQLYVNRAQRKDERIEMKIRFDKQKADRSSKSVKGVNLYVKNLDDTIDDAALEEAFSVYGSITSAKVMRDAQGRSKGFGFVCFTQADEATRAVCEMHTSLLGSKPLYVALAQRKDERRQQLISEINSFQQTRLGMAPIIQTPNAGFFQQAQFPRPPYYPQSMMGTQPRWNRPTGMPGSIPQVNVPRQMTNPYFAPQAAGGLNASAIAHLNQLRQPSSLVRQMMPAGLHSGAQMVNNVMLTGQPRRPAPTMAQITSNGMPQPGNALHAVRAGQPRPLVDQSMHRQMPVQFNQPVARPVAGQANPTHGLASVMSPLGDQLTARPAVQPPQSARNAELGERLFPLVAEFDPSRASKITGMLLGLDDSEIVHLMQAKDALKAKIDEAIGLLEAIAARAEHSSQNRGDVNGAAASVGAKDNA